MDITIKFVGATPLLQHNVRLADSLDEATRRLSEATSALKRDKTEAAAHLKARREWEGGLYHDPQIGVYVPSTWVSGALVRGGVVYGRKGTAVKQALVLQDFEIPLVHNGPDSLEDMWKDPQYRDTRAARVGKAVVMRTRPKFPEWALVTQAYLDESALDYEILQAIADKAGMLVGIGDYRPEKGGTFGRFKATIEKV
jgi:hypothetical protein